MDGVSPPDDPDIALAIAYAPSPARTPLTTLFALDQRLASIVTKASEPGLALIRLVWWRDALAGIGSATIPAEPLLAALAATGLPPDGLAGMIEGWEALLDDPTLVDDGIERHAAIRGGGLFALAGGLLGASSLDRARRAGAGWARIDLVRRGLAQRAGGNAVAAAMARDSTADGGGRWPRPLRPLGQLDMLARRDAARGGDRLEPRGARARLARIAAYHLVGW